MKRSNPDDGGEMNNPDLTRGVAVLIQEGFRPFLDDADVPLPVALALAEEILRLVEHGTPLPLVGETANPFQ
jgi:hypothetical protein